MKRPNSSDSLAGVGTFSTYPPCHGNVDEEEEEDLCSNGVVHAEKKRRLRVEQVKALERSFEVENKLEPERKTRLAAELGLQPRQVAIWFQNRRARWKTKQLERDYGTLKESFDSLKLSHDALRRDNEALLSEISDLKAKLAEEGGRVGKEEHQVETNHQIVAIKNIEEREEDEQREMESDSSDVLNEENLSFCSDLVSGGELFGSLNYTSSSSSPWQCYEPRSSRLAFANHPWKVEEEMGCGGFFSDEQTPPPLWYSSDQWTS